jgi:hypothetical protein
MNRVRLVHDAGSLYKVVEGRLSQQKSILLLQSAAAGVYFVGGEAVASFGLYLLMCSSFERSYLPNDR